MRRMTGVGLALWLLLASPWARGQGERVGGRVVNALDGRPVPHAAVSLEDTKSDRVIANADAGEDGIYRFDAVPAGKYRLLARATGYLAAAYLAHPPFSTAIVTGAGLPTGALIVKLTPFAEMSGRVVDEAGDPVEHATVTLYREDLQSAEDRVRRVRGGQTSDDGRYDFDALPAGSYYLTASAQPWYAVHAPLDRGDSGSQAYRSAVDPALDVAYSTVFYPNAGSAEGASPLALRGGDAVVANLQMMPQRAQTLTIRGTSSEGAVPRFAQLTRMIFGQQERVFAQSDFADGTQRLSGIAPGQYSLQEGQGRNGGTPAETSSIDLTAGSVIMDASVPGQLASLAVTVQTEATAAAAAKLQLNLRDGKGHRVSSSQVDAKGAASFPDLRPGDYRFALFGEGHLKVISAMSVNGHAVPDQVVHVSGGGEIAVTLTASGNPVELDGFARREGKPAAGSMVVLVPAGANTDTALYRRDQSDLDGSFTFRNVSPGAYLLVAIDDGWSLRWDDSKVLMPYLLHSVPVAVEANGSGAVHVSEPVVTQAR